MGHKTIYEYFILIFLLALNINFRLIKSTNIKPNVGITTTAKTKKSSRRSFGIIINIDAKKEYKKYTFANITAKKNEHINFKTFLMYSILK